MRKVEKEIEGLELRIAQLQVETRSGYNDGWISEHYRKELAEANKEYLDKKSKANTQPQRTNYESIIEDINPESLLADGFEDALIGHEATGGCAVYCYNRCLDILMERDQMTYEEAHEFMEFNVVCAHMGDFTPIFIHVFAKEQISD
jgi:hypothetical protein